MAVCGPNLIGAKYQSKHTPIVSIYDPKKASGNLANGGAWLFQNDTSPKKWIVPPFDIKTLAVQITLSSQKRISSQDIPQHHFKKVFSKRIVILYLHLIFYLRGIHKARANTQANNRHSETNLAITLVSICSVFFVCHALRLYLGLKAVFLIDRTFRCMKEKKVN